MQLRDVRNLLTEAPAMEYIQKWAAPSLVAAMLEELLPSDE